MNALQIMKQLNPNALIGEEGDRFVMIWDHSDHPDSNHKDSKIYRLELQCTRDGNHAIAYCRYNPHGVNSTFSYEQSHMSQDGFLCLSHETSRELTKSPLDIKTAFQRARFWCSGYSYMIKHGYKKAVRDIPGWGKS